jgi:hypothetical protein
MLTCKVCSAMLYSDGAHWHCPYESISPDHITLRIPTGDLTHELARKLYGPMVDRRRGIQR